METKVVAVPQYRRNFWLTISAAVVAAILATLIVIKLVPTLLFRQAPAAEDPILMAGGSLTVHAGAGGAFHVSSHDAVYTPANGTIRHVYIFYRDAAGVPSVTFQPFDPASDSVQLNYCGDAQSCSDVSAHSNPSGHGFVFGPVDGDTIVPGTNVFTHNPAAGYIHSVAFKGTTYLCADATGDGKCSVVAGYCLGCK